MSNKFPDLRSFDAFSFDTETTGLNPKAGAQVFGFSVSTGKGDYYYDIRETPKAVDWINDQFKNIGNNEVVCHNLSFDYRMSKATGINVPLANATDTVINACLINEHEHSYSLDNLSRKYTSSYKKGDQLYKDLAALFGGRATRNVQMPRISDAPVSVVAPYAMGDTRSTLELHEYQQAKIREEDLHKIVAFEKSLTPTLIAAEEHGVRVDIPAAEVAVSKLSVEIKRMQKELDDIAGFHCNPQPSGDIKKLFTPKWKDQRWWACDGTPLEETPAGQASLGADAMRIMSHPAAALILELRSIIKTRDTFLVGHVLESAQNGRVYPTINQTKGETGGTGTGRLSYTGPALQQIPDRNKRIAEIVKSVFLPDEGHVWIDSDMASFEVRIFAHLVNMASIMEAYSKNPEIDFHQYVSDITNLVRNATYSGQANAKQLNLSMIFNSGNGAIAEAMGMPWAWESFIPADSIDGKEIVYRKAGPEAMQVIDMYHEHLPGVKKLAFGCKKTAEDRGYLFTRHGRHLRFPNRRLAYKASGILIQATSADENKENWLLANEALRGTDAKLLLNTHDSYSFSVPEGEEDIMKKVKERIEQDRGLRVPMILEVCHPGQNWWDSKANAKGKRWL